jgi:hypothetical protein
MVSPQKIKYNGIFSDTGLGALDIILDVAFDSDNGAMSSYLNRSAVVSESHDGRYKNTIRYKYDELFSPQFTIVKKDCSDFTQEEVRKVLKYLTSTDKPALLEVYYEGASNVVDWACIGGFTSIEMYKIANSRTVGIVAQFEAVTPFAMSDLYTITKTINGATTFTINIDTDDNKPVYPKITINHGYGDPPTPHPIIRLPNDVIFNGISDMADYVENTVYYNAHDGLYYYKAYTPTFTKRTTLPNYVDWTIQEVNHPYTEEDEFATNTFYYYEYENMYYWKNGDTHYSEPTLPTYGGWKTKKVNRRYTASDVYEDKTIYNYAAEGTYYWMAPYNFYKSLTNPNLQTTSVKITNQHYDLFDRPDYRAVTIVKNNTSTEKIVVDGANKVIYSSSTRRIFGDDFTDWAWLPLYDGKNEITVEGDCEVTLEYRTVIKCGEY